MEQKTLGGKTREHWTRVAERIVGLIGKVDRMRELAMRMVEPSGEDVAQEAADDIDALIDALALIDFAYARRFGEQLKVTKPKEDRPTPVQ